MGIFSIYCGLMYNDFMALPLSFFTTCYETDPLTKVTTRKPGCVYPVGFDPKLIRKPPHCDETVSISKNNLLLVVINSDSIFCNKECLNENKK